MYHRICAITVVRIITTTEINPQNTMQQYSMIALLACLEALLGVINACLPVMKPIFSRLGATSIFSSFRMRTPKVQNMYSGRPMGNQVLCEGRMYPHISPPRQIVHRDSLHMFSPGLPADVRAPSTPLPNFSLQPLSKFYLPRTEWDHGPSKSRKGKGVSTITVWDYRHRPSEEDSPTSSWQPQWQSHYKDMQKPT